MSNPTRHFLATCLLALVLPAPSFATGPGGETAPHTKCLGAAVVSPQSPAPADPYPLMAAGWGSELGKGLMASRWVEDWSGMAAVGRAPSLKAIPISESTHLTLNSEVRLRWAARDDSQLLRGAHWDQGQLRAVFGADLRISSHIRTYVELGTGLVEGENDEAAANFDNQVSLQQLFVEVRGHAGSMLVGAMVGRQEYSDGPRQLISLSDGPNLHRTWNGVRLYTHGQRRRFGGFAFRETQLGRGAFDEKISDTERLHGLNASFIVSPGEGPNTYLDSFWIHSESAKFRVAGRVAADDRDTAGFRLWGRRGPVRFDWTMARQTGRTDGDRTIDAWGAFAVHSLQLSESGWKPRLTSRFDLASGGGAYGTGAVRDFNPLYASSNYLGESQFLALSNLLMMAPGMQLSPSAGTTLSLEFGFARRLVESDAVYAAGMRPYAGTERVSGLRIGELARLSGRWTVSQRLSLNVNLEYLKPGEVLKASGFTGGAYGYVSTTYRY
ncbi:MAG: hypothetical protein DCF27_00515 [Lysobacteraceae bacterium]|nr:MAG: hypothetical protein DCF27_00515 [Xanthomonadaceae bacterium]